MATNMDSTLFPEDEALPAVFHALPYEITHALVQTVTMHAQEYHNVKKELQTTKEADPNLQKTKSKKIKERWDGLQCCERHTVLNKRTGWIASKEWLQTHITVGSNGMPCLRNPSSKATPWVLTVKIDMKGSDAEIYLRPSVEKPFRRVICRDLSTGGVKAKLASIEAGYSHLLSNAEEDEEEDRCATNMEPAHTLQ